ncbi:MAG: alpha/beta hydrolase [Phenylobacterium sp.]|uniref:alpha/beta fold hydrolase n=1 Tax=Phenylobacterium sp. TaxID=1871053 RepID=UPI001A534651|nr:alpha/beta hydrolase [Phenylobacterium sp.]MBL8555002.1 alpha/beta hydrolase [Phenylobacterium sp.]
MSSDPPTAARGARPGPRIALAILLAAATVAGCGGTFGPAQAEDATPGTLVPLEDGRRINLRCVGRGSPTVILESGFSAYSRAWTKVQPALARTTRVCAYDRAGYGFSDPGPLPRDGAAIARDLDRALEAAKEEGPYVLVGHSAGGLYARLFAARRPGEVRGLVLLDPTVEALAPPGRDGLTGIRRRVQRCLAAAEARPQPAPQDPAWEGCVPGWADDHVRKAARDPETWRDQLSELDAIFGRTSEQVARLGGLLGDVPAYVITASDTAASAQQVGLIKPQSLAELQHLRLALSFGPGFQRTVYSSHLVMIDRPEVVIEAVSAMVKAARADSRPEPLPPSETTTLEPDPAAEATPPTP